jgi:hypothetical protein
MKLAYGVRTSGEAGVQSLGFGETEGWGLYRAVGIKFNDSVNHAFIPTFSEVLWHKSQMSMVLVNVVEGRPD